MLSLHKSPFWWELGSVEKAPKMLILCAFSIVAA